ncbi:RNA-directed DNA polymerase (Reverse transcriptase), partial [Trifolium medium]|nr:RNA-directed DNA polymerase (Reverse transcriptase) [Trifolium medium]
KSKELALRMVKSKTIELYGFPSSVNVSDVKRYVEKLTGEGSVVAMKIRVEVRQHCGMAAPI